MISIDGDQRFEIIDTPRLKIRTLGILDLETFAQYRNLPEVWRFQAWRPKATEEIAAFLRENSAGVFNTADTWYQLAICLQNDQLIGDIGIHFLTGHTQVEIGYTIAPDYQGCGYAYEAVLAVISFLFTGLKKRSITASVDPDNLKSIRLLEKLGFEKRALVRQSVFIDDQWYDDAIYELKNVKHNY